MKIRLVAHEMYPVYRSSGGPELGTEVEVSEELWDKYIEAKGEFYTYLDALEEVVLKQHRNGI